MIELNAKKIEFLTNDRRKRKQDKSCELLYGAECSTCNNIIVASFIVDEPIDLWSYEQSSILKTRGEKDIGSFSHYFPTVESTKGESCFESTVVESEGKTIQTIRMKNHLIQPDKIGKQAKDKYEVGERPCTYAAAGSLRKDMALKLALALTNTDVNELSKWDWVNKTDRVMEDYQKAATGLRFAKTKGPIPYYAVLIPKDKITYGAYVWDKKPFYAGSK
jgi:hypothetical protein